MKYRYLEKTYCFGSYGLTPMEPGDRWVAEGVVRFHLSAMWVDMEKIPERFAWGEISVADYVPELADHGFPGYEEEMQTAEKRERGRRPFRKLDYSMFDFGEDYDTSEPVIVVEYGPDDWRVIDGWGRIARAHELGMKTLPAVRVGADQAIAYLADENDVRRFIQHWNFKTAYWERHDRIQGLLSEDRPGFTEVFPEAESAWKLILAAAADREVEIPLRWNRWFAIHGDGTKVFIGEARYMSPVCPLTFDRQVRHKEFLEIFPLYEEWESSADEEGIRERARRITISYEYIFAMIRCLGGKM